MYIYIYITTIFFASWYIAIIKNTQDPSNTGKTFKYVSPKHREKTLQLLLLHKDILTIYENHNRQPKGFNTKFNLSLCAKNKDLQRSCQSILNKASRNILKEIIKAVNIDIHYLKRKRKQLKTELYNTMLHNEFKTTCTWIKKKVDGIQRTVRQRHS